MNNIESFKIGLNELRSNKLRAALTMLGIIFGVASVIAMMSIGEGARQETLQQIELMGTNNIIINRVSGDIEVNREIKTKFSTGLTLKDSRAIKELNPFVQFITPQKEFSIQSFYKSKIFEAHLIGTTIEYPETFNSKILAGSFFNEYHFNSYSNVCVIGSDVKNELFRFENPLKKKLKFGDQWFEIIGVISPKNISTLGGSGLSLRNFNKDIYLPFTSLVYKLVKSKDQQTQQPWWEMNNSAHVIDRNSVDQLTVKVKNPDNLKEAAALVQRILDRRHYGVKDFDIILPEQLLEQKQKTQRIFNIVMGAIAGISLLVGGIGIMNIMLANILERTREIGVRRAVGATKTDVLNQFIFEALIISIAGGILGIVLGFILTSLISTYAEWKTIISPFSVLIAFAVSVATGLIFGIYPARTAAYKNPIDSLRYE